MWIIIPIIALIVAAVVVLVFIFKRKEKMLQSALSESPRLKRISEINKQFNFLEYKDYFEYVIHFKDLDEFKKSDLKLIKYSFFVKNKSKVVKSISSMNQNIELFERYLKEIQVASNLDDDDFLSNHSVNRAKYHDIEKTRIGFDIKKPLLSCRFEIFYNYSSPTGRSSKESDHFSFCVDKVVDVETFLSETFPEAKLEDYGFKSHYLNPHLHFVTDLLVTEEAENFLKECDERENRAKEFFGGANCINNGILLSLQGLYQLALETVKSNCVDLGLTFEIEPLNNCETVFVIEKQTYIFVGIEFGSYGVYGIRFDDIGDQIVTNGSVIVREFTYNPFFDRNPFNALNNKSTDVHVSLIYYDYFHLPSGAISERNIYFSTYNHLYPSNKVLEINDSWEGIPASLILYKITRSTQIAYAVAITDNIEKSVNVALSKYPDLFNDENPYPYDHGGYELFFGSNFKNILDIVSTDFVKQSTSFDEKDFIFSHIYFYLIPIFIKSLDRQQIAQLKKGFIDNIDESALKKYDEYPYVNGHKKWKNEYLLFELCKKIYGNRVIYQHRPPFLKSEKGQLSYDIYLPTYKIAIEYQGEQHFRPVDFFGGDEAFQDLKRRDELKKKLSEENGVSLIEILYSETLTTDLITTKVKKVLVAKKLAKKDTTN